MKSTLTIKDLPLDRELDRKAMTEVRGGNSDQANGVGQSNLFAAFAPTKVANSSLFGGCGPVDIQATSELDQYGYNDNWAENGKNASGVFGS